MDDSKTDPVPASPDRPSDRPADRRSDRVVERLCQRIERLEQRIRALEQDNGEIISLLIAIKAGLEECIVEPADDGQDEEEDEAGEAVPPGLSLH